MSQSADAADQVVNMTMHGIETVAKVGLQAGEIGIKVAGKGAMVLATYLFAILTGKKKTKGRTRLETMLKSGKELKVFSVKAEDIKEFVQQAKTYGILYCGLHDKKCADGYCDFLVNVEDAPRINRIVERFHLATVDIPSIKAEIVKGQDEKNIEPTVLEMEEALKDSPAVKDADAFLDDLLSAPEGVEPDTTVVQDSPDLGNPTMAGEQMDEPQLERSSENSGKQDEDITIEDSAPAEKVEPLQPSEGKVIQSGQPRSIHDELEEIKERRRSEEQNRAKSEKEPQSRGDKAKPREGELAAPKQVYRKAPKTKHRRER